MKKTVGSVLIAAMILFTAACSGGTKDAGAQTQASQAEPIYESTEIKETTAETKADKETVADTTDNQEETTKSGKIDVDENLLTVDVTFGASYFENLTPEEIKAKAKEKGYLDCRINEDGSVTYKLTKAKRNEMLKEYEDSLEETFQEYINGDKSVSSFIDIKHNNDFSKIDVYVDKEKYSSWDSLYSLAFYFEGAYYQNFAGVADDDIDIVVNYIDEKTGETLNTDSYKAWKEKQKESEKKGEEVDVSRKLTEIRNWLSGDIWNKGFCDFSHFKYDGKDSCGNDIDIELALEVFKNKYAMKEEYDSFIHALPDTDYEMLKKVWDKLMKEADNLYEQVKDGVTIDGTALNTDLFVQYRDTFSECVKEAKKK